MPRTKTERTVLNNNLGLLIILCTGAKRIINHITTLTKVHIMKYTLSNIVGYLHAFYI